MRKNHIILNAVFISILLGWVNISSNEDKCVFNADAITDDFLKENKAIKAYNWSNQTKTATILLKTGEYVFVKKWACVHYGMKAKKITMLSYEELSDIGYWEKDLLSFGKQFLDTGDFKLYQSTIEKMDWAQGKEKLMVNDTYKIKIPDESYPEFYVMLERRTDMVVTTIFYYMN